jgi:integrase
MLTGCRPGEAMSSTWDQFSEPSFWVKPSSRTKQRKIHKVPLGPAAIEFLGQIRARNSSEYVFPGMTLRTLHIAWKKISHAAGLAGARPYDLRHTFASVGAGGGLSLQIIGKLLGHTQFRTTLKYAHLADDPLREAADRITTTKRVQARRRRTLYRIPNAESRCD